ncbi:unnamed protein product [Diabrotica balteata]|uniref:Uncharacterized protein n=1 Tax=Diabrotica balteata TaxID=107213 RepID=A0A9N9SN67_DIABA|nr:unnamed protein product [Diabrotica balteata]
MPHQLEQIPIPIFSCLPTLPEDNSETLCNELQTNRFEEDDSDFEEESTRPELFTQKELSDLIRDMNLPILPSYLPPN